jgi:hypothetical protein
MNPSRTVHLRPIEKMCMFHPKLNYSRYPHIIYYTKLVIMVHRQKEKQNVKLTIIISTIRFRQSSVWLSRTI